MLTSLTRLLPVAWTRRWDSLPRDDRDALFMLGVIALVVLPHASHLPAWSTALTLSLMAWRGQLAWRHRELPGPWVTVGMLLVTVAATWASHRTLLGRDAGVTLVVGLLALKTLELRARRDALVVFFLGFFTVLTQFFFSQTMFTALSMLLAVMGLLTGVVNAHQPAGRPALADSARTAGTLVLFGTPVMVVLFALFPRVAPLWSLPGDTQSARSGLSADMRVGHMAELALDDSVAFRVRFLDEPPPSPDRLYFRGPVLTDFDGARWTPMAPLARSAEGRSIEPLSPALRYEVTLEPHRMTWLLALDATPTPPAIEGWPTTLGPEFEWQTNRPIQALLRYEARSHLDYRYGADLAAGRQRRWTALPANSNPRTLALAASWRADPARAQASSDDWVRAAQDLLRTGGYSYTLEPGVYGTHTADEFWFDRKAGFCEHIASSFVVLMRALGVPARVVTGYQGAHLNGVDGHWVVRQSDAHAWAEVWMAGRGWVRVDPTASVAPGRIGSPVRLQARANVVTAAVQAWVGRGVFDTLQSWREAMDNRWNQWVINYSQGRQMRLLQGLGFSSPNWEDLTTVLAALLVLASGTAALWAQWDKREHDPWRRLLADARQRLQATGLNMSPATPPRAMAEAVLQRWGADDPQARGWHQALLRLEALRYAAPGRADPAQELRALRCEWRQLTLPATPSSASSPRTAPTSSSPVTE